MQTTKRRLITPSMLLFGLAIFSHSFISDSIAQTTECPSPFPSDFDQGAFVACMSSLAKTNAALSDALETISVLQNRITALESPNASSGTVPSGAVVAFDNSSLDQDTCPLGWQPFKEARSRVIVGVGDPSKAPGKMGYDEKAKALSHFVLRQHGGEEKFSLSGNEIPGHEHTLRYSNGTTPSGGSEFIVTGGGNGDHRIGGKEAASPHNNMPPFIALYYCKKD